MIVEFINERILTDQVKFNLGKEVALAGWLHKKIDSKNLLIRDRKGILKVNIENLSKTEIEKINNIQPMSILIIKGIATNQEEQIQLNAHQITIDVPVKYKSPIDIEEKIDHHPNNLNNILENRVLNIRNIPEQYIFKIQTAISDALRQYLKNNDFTEFYSPKLLACASEGGTEVFKVDYFGKQAILAQSAQFYKQIMVGAFERIFELGSTFRAEASISTRHMTDFLTLDVEMGFITDLSDIMKTLYNMLIYINESIWNTHSYELKKLGAIPSVLNPKMPIVTLEELHDLCYKHTGKDFRKEKDPNPFEEKWICDFSLKHWQSEAVFITEFPASEMKFYQHRNKKNPNTIDRFDLIFRGIEICTGGRRENNYEKLIEQMEQLGINPNDSTYSYYLQALKYGLPAHGGFGLGLARLNQQIIGLNSVKEAIIFCRDKNRLLP